MILLIIILLSAVGVTADYFIKLAGLKPAVDIKFFVLGTIIYACTAFGWFYVIRHAKLASLGAIYATTISLMLVIMGIVLFKERLSVGEIIGILLSLVSLWLLTRFA